VKSLLTFLKRRFAAHLPAEDAGSAPLLKLA
jgi:hypothetical protein